MQPLLSLVSCFLVGLVGAHSRCLSENLLAVNGISEGQVWDSLRDVQDLPEGCPALWGALAIPNMSCFIHLGC